MEASADSTWVQRQITTATRRPLGRIETALYEWYAAGATCRLVEPVLRARIDEAPPGPVLDVGCGSGRLSVALAEASDRAVVGVEPSLFERRRFPADHPSVRVTAGSADALPVGDGTMAAVVSSCSYKHWPDLGAGIADCARVLAPNGVLVLVEVDGGDDPGDLRRFAAETELPRVFHGIYASLGAKGFTGVTPEAAVVANHAAAAGLTVVEQARIPGQPFAVVTARSA